MKKLAILTSLAIATPVFACPNMDHDDAPKTTTAEKAKKAPDTTKQTPAPAPAPKTDTAKDTAKTKDTTKKPDKVSQN